MPCRVFCPEFIVIDDTWMITRKEKYFYAGATMWANGKCRNDDGACLLCKKCNTIFFLGKILIQYAVASCATKLQTEG